MHKGTHVKFTCSKHRMPGRLVEDMTHAKSARANLSRHTGLIDEPVSKRRASLSHVCLDSKDPLSDETHAELEL